MGSTFDPNTSYSGTGSTAVSTGTTLPGTSSSTATQGSTTQSSVMTAQQVTQFLATNGISSTDQAAYISGGQLTELGHALQWYDSLDEADRQSAQSTLVALGYLTGAGATGEASSGTLSAFKAMLTQGHLPDFQNALANPTTPIRAQVNTELGAAQKELTGTENVSATLENPSTLTQDITTAFDNALGYAPSQEQINAFISQIQGQDVSFAEGAANQNRAQAQADISQAKQETTALDKMGTDGVDTFLTAYRNAVNGGTQGPVTGTLPAPGAANPNPSGQLFGASAGPGTRQVPNTYGIGGALATDLNPATLLRPSGPQIVTPGMQSGGTHPVAVPAAPPRLTNAPAGPLGSSGTVPAHGGEYALSPSMWDQGLSLLGTEGTAWRKKYPSAGSATPQIQNAVASALATHLFEQTDSWAQVAQQMAAGNHPSSFANNIANSVTSEINSLQTQANSTPVVTTKVTAPDATAEAALAAKQADPIGYEAANVAAAGDLLSRMIQGAPQLADYSTADTFSGPAPVPAAVAANGTGV